MATGSFVLPSFEMLPSTTSFTVVALDIEGTGLLATDPQIVQIAAIYTLAGGQEVSFSCYVLPSCQMSAQAERVTGFKVSGNKLTRNGEELDACQPKEGLLKFLDWLKDCPQKPLLVAHNGSCFDAPILTKSMKTYDLDDIFCQTVAGMGDSLTLMWKQYPERKAFNLHDLCKHFFPEILRSLDHHEGLNDAKALLHILKLPRISKAALCNHSWLVNDAYVEYIMKTSRNILLCYPSIKRLEDCNIIRISMIATTLAAAGYKYEDLRDIARTKGLAGLRKLLVQDLKCCRNDGLAKALVKHF